jgi:hypothetical protein
LLVTPIGGFQQINFVYPTCRGARHLTAFGRARLLPGRPEIALGQG